MRQPSSSNTSKPCKFSFGPYGWCLFGSMIQPPSFNFFLHASFFFLGSLLSVSESSGSLHWISSSVSCQFHFVLIQISEFFCSCFFAFFGFAFFVFLLFPHLNRSHNQLHQYVTSELNVVRTSLPHSFSCCS